MQYGECVDPLAFKQLLWPQVVFYPKQIEIIYSVKDNDETFVAAGNMLGKDFTAAFICLWFFLTRAPCRIITTSAKDDHLDVLWGEMNWFVSNAAYPLDSKRGGPLLINQREMRKVINGMPCPLSYIKGMVANEQSIAAMGGHHSNPKVADGLPHAMLVCDEASSVPTPYYDTALPWAKRILVFGNTWPCENFFRKAIDGGDIPLEFADKPTIVGG